MRKRVSDVGWGELQVINNFVRSTKERKYETMSKGRTKKRLKRDEKGLKMNLLLRGKSFVKVIGEEFDRQI